MLKSNRRSHPFPLHLVYVNQGWYRRINLAQTGVRDSSETNFRVDRQELGGASLNFHYYLFYRRRLIPRKLRLDPLHRLEIQDDSRPLQQVIDLHIFDLHHFNVLQVPGRKREIPLDFFPSCYEECLAPAKLREPLRKRLRFERTPSDVRYYPQSTFLHLGAQRDTHSHLLYFSRQQRLEVPRLRAKGNTTTS